MTAAEVQFRPATDADWPAIWPIFHQVVAAADTYPYDPATDFATGRGIWLAPPPDRAWLVSGPDGTVLGTYKTGPNRPGPGSHVATASYMVAAEARGRGIGRAMVVHSIEQARTAGFRGIQFNAVAASNHAAVRLYEDLGFRVVGSVPGGFRHPQVGYVDLLIMYRDLTGA